MAAEPFALEINDGPTTLQPKDRLEFSRETGILEFFRPTDGKFISIAIMRSHIINNAADLEQLGEILAAATGLSVSEVDVDRPSKTSRVTFKK